MRKTNLKGPWYAVQPYECAGWWIVSTDPEGNDSIDESGDGGFEKETAHLIAAAPELYETLEAIIARWDTPLWKDIEPTAVFINKGRAALAKARGEI